MISKIVFTADGFRTTAGEPVHQFNVDLMYALFSDLLTRITGKPAEIRLALAAGSIPEFIALQGGEVSLDGWARVFWADPSPALVEAIGQACDRALIVGFELPPVMIAAFDKLGIPWIDLTVSPLRFLPDWAFHIKTSRHFDLGGIRHAAVQDGEIDAAIRHVTRWYSPPWYRRSPIRKPTRVFFAQSARDRTLIRDGRFCSTSDLADLDVRDMLLKPHPGEPDNEIVRYLKSRGAVVTNVPTYTLLANQHVEVVTFSSSVAFEARAFGRKVTSINPMVQAWSNTGLDVLRHWGTHRVWCPLLGSAGIPVAPAAGPEWVPNLVRSKYGGQGLSMKVWA